MKILIISPGYPDKTESSYPFVEQLVEEWAKQGHSCAVVSCFSVSKHKRLCKYKTRKIIGDTTVTIYRPNIISFSTIRLFGFSITDFIHNNTMKMVLSHIHFEPDVVYCHFWESGYIGQWYAEKKNIPCFVASGESNIKNLLHGMDESFAKKVDGVVCVSTKNKDESIALGLTNESKCGVFPNAIDSSLFRIMDKSKCREKLGIPHDAFVPVFVGAFNERKGPLRICSALNQIEDDNIRPIFIGSGNQQPNAHNTLFQGRLMHNEIPEYLNAADIFVLPTLNEGCCNAVVEAMACGLPIISSNLSFNWDVLDDSNSILVDPMNISQIKEAIIRLRDDKELKDNLSVGAIKKAEELTIEKRATNIINFISHHTNTTN